jgi:DhnA family fructose-bisphosphate aldolase class Ia
MDKTRRLNRILRPDNRVLIVAMDHGSFSGPAPGIEQPGSTLRRVMAGGADALLTTFGIARRYPAELASAGLILRADGGTSPLGPSPDRTSQLFGVEDALRLGADGLAVTVGLGLPYERETLAYLAALGSECAHWGLVLVAEMMPGGFDNAALRTLANVKLGARIAAEMGADMVKTPYVEGFGEVIDTCFVPVVIPGGSKMSPSELLAMVRAAMAAGAAGVAVGRNIWQEEDPGAMTQAIARILHEAA